MLSRCSPTTAGCSASSPSAWPGSGARPSFRSRSASARRSYDVAAAAAGGVIAFYQLGYGIAAFGVGPLVDSGVELSTVYALAAIVAAAMGLVSFVVAGGRAAAIRSTGS